MLQIEFVCIEDKLPYEYYLFVDTKSEETSINCENIDSFVRDEKTQRLTIVYWVAKKDFFGKPQKELEQKIEIYECAEGELMLKTFNGIRNKIMGEQNRKEQFNFEQQ